jgi:hypothetical protein
MYRQTQRFIGISRFIDTWATCFDPSSGHPQALKEYRYVLCSPCIYKPRYTNKSLCLTVHIIPYFTLLNTSGWKTLSSIPDS